MKKLFLSTLAALSLAASTACAVQVNVTAVSGTWGGTDVAVNGVGSSTISWGTGASGPSSYVFSPVALPLVDAVSPFVMGTFTHNNFPIGGAVPTTMTLDVNVSGTIDAAVFGMSSSFDFMHYETPNNANPCGAGGAIPCADLVTLSGVPSSIGDIVNVSGTDYAFNILGFSLNADGSNPFTNFVTAENAVNTAYLVGEFAPVPVPLPASMALLLAGLGGLFAFGRRKSANQV